MPNDIKRVCKFCIHCVKDKDDYCIKTKNRGDNDDDSDIRKVCHRILFPETETCDNHSFVGAKK